ncbi:MAG: UDP-N-acetylglucosamine--N-acetylmuramyl-(pentapeptide) pyrophosphoryl-undecaprenol N-acetylglucosamine transferase [Synergistaceae bacterium]|jgi:UDP-N-acetylglucosamine--N-acetylmuramyl-(pentapeptide) pyrophosphoryl-undecaprenol N-acetylglucosamine transferase|nr:UDP-N-acetylglucosamine--N-acetylmuramyl-(pentapeptide) pyrophosphoryl-undecaprenol N-acetylglucosamine transferase [Synergistaceae bacterium]
MPAKKETPAKAEKILIVAGGTGGHIFPALAFGRWILDQKKAERVFYLSGSRPLEGEIYASQGIRPYRLSLSGSPLGSSSRTRNFRRWMELLHSFCQTGYFLRRERPDLCFLFGGYVSLMPLLWCRLLGIRVIAHEQNACAGKVTRLAARLRVPIASGWNECRGVDGFAPVGVPVRPLRKISRKEAASALEIDVKDGDFVVGVVGGSLSSAALSTLVEKVSESVAGGDGESCVFVVLNDIPAPAFEKRIHFVGRRWNMNPFYSLCDAVVCRAGASTLAEVASYGIPTLAIPWKSAADGHQEANAECFSALTGNSIWKEDGNENAEGDALREVFSKFVTRAREARGEKGRENESAIDAASSALWRFGREGRERRLDI